MCVIIPREVLQAVLNDRPSRELWALIDAEQRKDLPPPAWPDAPADRPLQLLEGPSVEEIKAGDEADAARQRVEGMIAELYRQRAPRADNCGLGATRHRRRHAPGRPGAVDDILLRHACGRHSCPHCWRRRECRTLRRAAPCLLDASAEGPGHSPRLSALYVSEMPWLEWETADRRIRRAIGGRTGRLRVRQRSGRVLAIAERPFPGSRAVTPAEAADLASQAIAELHPGRHSYRQLGSWNDRRPRQWTEIGRYPHLDLAAVYGELKDYGARPRHWRSQDVRGLIWRCDSRENADALLAACPTLASGDLFHKRPKSDTSEVGPVRSSIPDAEDGYFPDENPFR